MYSAQCPASPGGFESGTVPGGLEDGSHHPFDGLFPALLRWLVIREDLRGTLWGADASASLLPALLGLSAPPPPPAPPGPLPALRLETLPGRELGRRGLPSTVSVSAARPVIDVQCVDTHCFIHSVWFLWPSREVGALAGSGSSSCGPQSFLVAECMPRGLPLCS